METRADKSNGHTRYSVPIRAVTILLLFKYRPGKYEPVGARVQANETYFTHIEHELPQSAELRLPKGTHIAYDGLKLNL